MLDPLKYALAKCVCYWKDSFSPWLLATHGKNFASTKYSFLLNMNCNWKAISKSVSSSIIARLTRIFGKYAFWYLTLKSRHIVNFMKWKLLNNVYEFMMCSNEHLIASNIPFLQARNGQWGRATERNRTKSRKRVNGSGKATLA